MTNDERIKACAEEIAADVCTGCDDREHHGIAEDFANTLRKHFGESAPEQKETVSVSAIWLRRIGPQAQVLAEIAGQWRYIIRESADSSYSWIAEAREPSLWPLDDITEPVAPSVNTNAELSRLERMIEEEDCSPSPREIIPADAPQEPTCAHPMSPFTDLELAKYRTDLAEWEAAGCPDLGTFSESTGTMMRETARWLATVARIMTTGRVPRAPEYFIDAEQLVKGGGVRCAYPNCGRTRNDDCHFWGPDSDTDKEDLNSHAFVVAESSVLPSKSTPDDSDIDFYDEDELRNGKD